MEIKLTKEEKQDLEQQHQSERDKRIADRIKAVLLFSEGWGHRFISYASGYQKKNCLQKLF